MDIFTDAFSSLGQGFASLSWQGIVMLLVGILLLYLAVGRQIEPFLLLPIGFGIVLGNLPLAGMSADYVSPEGTPGVIKTLYDSGILTELFPVLLFIGLGAMIDFGPMLANPVVLIFGAAGQFGIFLTLILALSLGFARQEAVSIAVIGACDGPTAIYVTSKFARDLLPAVSIAAYSYMSLVPIIQPPIIKALTTEKERAIVMPYTDGKPVSQTTKILFPIVVTLVCGLIAPLSAPLIGMLMLGNLLREAGVVQRLSDTAQNELVNIVTLFLGLAIGSTMVAHDFLKWQTIGILCMGLVAFALDTVAGLAFGKAMSIITKGKVNPLIGACGISAFPMSARVISKIGLEANPNNFLIMHAMASNTAGQIGSVMAGGAIMALLAH